MRSILAALLLALSALALMPAQPASAGAYGSLANRLAETDHSVTEQVHYRRKRRGVYFSFGYGYPRHYGYSSYYRPYYYPRYYGYRSYGHRGYGYRYRHW